MNTKSPRIAHKEGKKRSDRDTIFFGSRLERLKISLMSVLVITLKLIASTSGSGRDSTNDRNERGERENYKKAIVLSVDLDRRVKKT